MPEKKKQPTDLDGDLAGFENWLVKYGRSPSTANVYVGQVRRALDTGFFERLTDTSLAPKHLALVKASIKAWCDYTDDREMLKQISRVRLPPPIRVKVSEPLSKEDWQKLCEEIDSAEYISTPVRIELGLMARRGFRCGDALRIKRTEMEKGVKTGVLDFEGKGRKRLRWSVGKSWKPYLVAALDYPEWDRLHDLISHRAAKRRRKAAAAQVVGRNLSVVTDTAGLDGESMHPHLLRHTYATHYYQACRDPKKLQDHMGWSDISVAMGYVAATSREELDNIADSLFDV